MIGAVHKVTKFLTNFDTPPLSHIVTHLGLPIFSSTCIYTCLYRGFVLVRGGVLFGGLSGVFCLKGFVRGGFCLSPLLSENICYNRKLNITFNFRFHMFEFFQSVTSHALGPPPPVTNYHTFSDPLALYGRPHTDVY